MSGRAHLYVCNYTQQDVVCCSVIGGDDGGTKGCVGALGCIIPHNRDRHAVATGYWATFYFEHRCADNSQSFSVYFKLRNDGDCMEMGGKLCTKEDAVSKRPFDVDSLMPSDGRKNAVQDTPVGKLEWFPGVDPLGGGSAMFLDIKP